LNVDSLLAYATARIPNRASEWLFRAGPQPTRDGFRLDPLSGV